MILLIKYRLTCISYGSSIYRYSPHFSNNFPLVITFNTSGLSANATKLEKIWHNYILILVSHYVYNIWSNFYVNFVLYNKFVDGTFSNTKLEIAQHASLRNYSSFEVRNG